MVQEITDTVRKWINLCIVPYHWYRLPGKSVTDSLNRGDPVQTEEDQSDSFESERPDRWQLHRHNSHRHHYL